MVEGEKADSARKKVARAINRNRVKAAKEDEAGEPSYAGGLAAVQLAHLVILEAFLSDLARQANLFFVKKRLGIFPTRKPSCSRFHIGGLTAIFNIAVGSIELLRAGEDDKKLLLCDA